MALRDSSSADAVIARSAPAVAARRAASSAVRAYPRATLPSPCNGAATDAEIGPIRSLLGLWSFFRSNLTTNRHYRLYRHY